MKIVHLIHSTDIGGAEKLVVDLLNNIDLSKHNITIICPNNSKVIEFMKSNLKKDIKIVPIAPKNKYDIKNMVLLVKYLRRNKFDAIHMHLEYKYGTFAAKLSGIKNIYWTQHLTEPYKKQYEHKINASLSRQSKCIIAVSNGVKDFLVEKGIDEKKIKVVLNGVDIKRFEIIEVDKESFRDKFGIDANDIVIGQIGRLHEQKGHKYLLQALPYILDNIKNIKVLIIGDGELKEELVNLVTKLKLENKVKFVGFRKDIPELLNFIDILVMPSLYEGLPLTVLEAMACRTAVIGSNIEGIREVIDSNNTGILVAKENVQELGAALNRLILDSELRKKIESNAWSTVRQNHTIEIMARQYEEIYDEYIVPN